jgi:DNA-binding NarL/FixJ family response regulator
MRPSTTSLQEFVPLPQLACLVGLIFGTWFVAELSNGFFEDRFFVVSLALALALGGYAMMLCRGFQQEKRLRRQAEELLLASSRLSDGMALRQDAGRSRLTQTANVTEALTPREREVLALIARGWTNQGIAEQLHISVNTVERHSANIYQKLKVRGRVEATAYAVWQGLVRPDQR